MGIKRILGIDPGSQVTGIGIIDVCTKSKKKQFVFAGHISLKDLDMAKRLAKLYEEVQNLVVQYQPNEVAIEAVFHRNNVSSVLKLGQARGVAIAAAVRENLPLFEYAPRAVKQAVTGMGQAEKDQIQKMCQVLLGIEHNLQADAADALAVAITHAHSEKPLPNQTTRRSKRRRVDWSEYDFKLKRNINTD